jgi:hypothetical protein
VAKNATKKGPPVLEVNLLDAKPLIVDCLRAHITPQLVSSPGVGKSAILKQIAEKLELCVIDIRLTEYDPTELNGYPFILNPDAEPDKVKAGHVPMSTFPVEGDEIPMNPKTGRRYKGWLIILDEFPSAALSVQAAAYKITLDRMVGSHRLHRSAFVVTAGNKATDKAIVNRLSTAQQSRLATLVIKVCADTWLDWAESVNIDYRVRSFIRYKPDMLHKFDPNHADLTFPCPRTWHFISRLAIANKWESIIYKKKPLLAGVVGHGACQMFYSFCEIFNDLPSIGAILKDPEGCTLRQEISVQHAAAGLVAHHINKKNADTLIKFLFRLPADLQTMTLREAIKRDDRLRESSAVQKWAAKNSKELIA